MAKINYKKENLDEIIDQAQKGDLKALEEIIRRVQKEVYTVFYHLTNKREDILDLTQEVLLKIAKNLSNLKEIKNFKSWLNRMVVNTYYDYIRKNPEKFVELSDEKFNEIKDKLGCEPGEKCFFIELDKIIKSALLTLPNDLRIVIVLREYEGLSYQDIAKITNSAIGTVKSRISRAREKLQKQLKQFI